MEITLLRHGKPATVSLKKLTASAFNGWVQAYNAAGLSPSSKPGSKALAYAQTCNAIVCSELPRSIESAQALNAGHAVLSSALFNEADLPAASGSRLKLSPKIWVVIFRVLWLLGYSKHCESYKAAKKRAKQAVNQLIEVALQHDRVLFVGHGIFNRMLAKELMCSGWTGAKNPPSKHWSLSVYESGNRHFKR